MITLNKPYFDNDDLKMLNDVLYNYNNIDYDEKTNTIEMLNKRCFRKWISNENKAKKESYTSEKKKLYLMCL